MCCPTALLCGPCYLMWYLAKTGCNDLRHCVNFCCFGKKSYGDMDELLSDSDVL